MIKEYEHICKLQGCQYTWVSKIKQPKSCPKCKRYDWNIIKRNK